MPKNKGMNKILSTGVLIGVVLVALLGGLALVVLSLRNASLLLSLDIKRGNRTAT